MRSGNPFRQLRTAAKHAGNAYLVVQSSETSPRAYTADQPKRQNMSERNDGFWKGLLIGAAVTIAGWAVVYFLVMSFLK